MRLELMTVEYFVEYVCVGNKERTNRKPANNQASAQYYTMSEVGIPMLRLQMI